MRIYVESGEAHGGEAGGWCTIDGISQAELVLLCAMIGEVADSPTMPAMARRFADALFTACESLVDQIADGVPDPRVHVVVQGMLDGSSESSVGGVRAPM